ncbi:MAG: UpxY family transcription antiterminator [Rikenellaceae bacterium]
MKTTFKREFKAKAMLDARSIENFIAMTRKSITVGGRRRMVTAPAIHNLIFVKVDRAQLQQIKKDINFLHNTLTKVDGVLSPIIIPSKDMEQFIGVTTKSLEQLIYLDSLETNLSKGTRVRITGGEFAGYEGVLMRVKGARDRRVVLSIDGVVAVAMAAIDADMIEKM